MHSCVYTTQKHKKTKKWIDGYVARKGKGLALYSEEKKVIHTTGAFNVREDENLETSAYLIYVEELEEFIGSKEENKRVVAVLDKRIARGFPTTEPFPTTGPFPTNSLEKTKEKIPDEQLKGNPGRTNDDILGLFEV